MKRLLFLITLLWGLASEMDAQTPYWVKNIPTPKSGNFYYRVTIAEGKTYKDAYAEAFTMAIYESYSKLVGIGVKINSDEETIKDGVMQAISSDVGYMQLPINKVCEYEEKMRTSSKIRLYVLWQVANSALIDPQFEFFNKCE